MEKLLTEQELADALGVKRTTMAAWRARGTGPRYVKVGRFTKYREADVDVWLQANTRISTKFTMPWRPPEQEQFSPVSREVEDEMLASLCRSEVRHVKQLAEGGLT